MSILREACVEFCLANGRYLPLTKELREVLKVLLEEKAFTEDQLQSLKTDFIEFSLQKEELDFLEEVYRKYLLNTVEFDRLLEMQRKIVTK